MQNNKLQKEKKSKMQKQTGVVTVAVICIKINIFNTWSAFFFTEINVKRGRTYRKFWLNSAKLQFRFGTTFTPLPDGLLFSRSW